MKDINTGVHYRRLLSLIFCTALISDANLGWADERVTRVYALKNSDVSNIARVINITLRDTTNSRVVSGQGRRLVITDTPDMQDNIAQLLPVLDQPMTETDPDKIQMKMIMNAAQYLRQQRSAVKTVAPADSKTASGAPAASTPAANPTGGAQSYDKFKPAAYKSIYASDDAKLTRGPRIIKDEPFVMSLSSLQLRGIFRVNTTSPLALLSVDGKNFTAHDGGLFQDNHTRVNNVTSKVLKDRVILVGQDRIPHEIKFKTSL